MRDRMSASTTPPIRRKYIFSLNTVNAHIKFNSRFLRHATPFSNTCWYPIFIFLFFFLVLFSFLLLLLFFIFVRTVRILNSLDNKKKNWKKKGNKERVQANQFTFITCYVLILLEVSEKIFLFSFEMFQFCFYRKVVKRNTDCETKKKHIQNS